MLVLLNKILTETGEENLFEIWPNLEVYFHGGVNFEPYRSVFKNLIGSDCDWFIIATFRPTIFGIILTRAHGAIFSHFY